MSFFRKKPVVIEAMKYDGTNFAALWEFTGKSAHIREISEMHAPLVLAVYTPEGVMKATIGDWIIRGVQGEFYPCKPDIFEATYEAVAGPAISTTGDSVASESVVSSSGASGSSVVG